MDETLHQLGALLLGSVPTIFLFLFLLVAYRILVYDPLARILSERRARTAGAIEQANAAAAAAAAKTREYEAQLRAARSKIFQARHERLEKLTQGRDAAIASAQEAAQRQVVEARNSMQADMQSAQRSIEGSIDDLATEILQAILPRGRAAAGSSR